MSYQHIEFVEYFKIRILFIEDTMRYKPVYNKSFKLLSALSNIHLYSHILNQDLLINKPKQHFLASLYKKRSFFKMKNLLYVKKKLKDMSMFSILFSETCLFNWRLLFQILFLQGLDFFFIAFKFYIKLYDYITSVISWNLKMKMKFYNTNKSFIFIFCYLNSILFFIKRLYILTISQLICVTTNTFDFKFILSFFSKIKLIVYKSFNKITLFYTLLVLFGFICNDSYSVSGYNTLILNYLKLFRSQIIASILRSRFKLINFYTRFINLNLVSDIDLNYLKSNNYFFSEYSIFFERYNNFYLSFVSIKKKLFNIVLFSLFNNFSKFKSSVLLKLTLDSKEKKSIYFTTRLFSKNRHLFNSSYFFRFRRKQHVLPFRDLVKTKFINIVMKRGKQMKASKFIKEVFFLFKTRIPHVSGSRAFLGSLLSIKPYAKLFNYKISGRKEKIFGPMHYRSQIAFSIKLLLNSALKRKSKHRKGDLDYNLVLGLFFEIYDISIRKRNCLSLNFMKEYNYLVSSMRFRTSDKFYNHPTLNLDLHLVPLLLLNNNRSGPNYKQMMKYFKYKNAEETII